jgi:hypothetical protein
MLGREHKSGKACRKVRSMGAQFVRGGGLQQIQRFSRIAMIQSKAGAQYRQKAESYGDGFRETPLQVVGQRLRLLAIA